ncbi:hypothetical protein SCHPADRAFT_840002 [Schizopora paradoxa]|uniref:Nucleic acid-binding protein n=1 Tax=Schizopora paradoxa TaxID=27342 RepID=A0A0H2R102_9AGAM|nr:hypothetical protein SCHPADRAFT_840002 [Schizopora paradoxa]
MSTTHYKVFLPAPTYAEIRAELQTPQSSRVKRQWEVLEYSSAKSVSNPISRTDTEIVDAQITTGDAFQSREWVLPPGTLEAVGSRISDLYKNVIFGDDDEEDDEFIRSRQFEDFTTSAFESRLQGVRDDGSLISWPPSDPQHKPYESQALGSKYTSRNFSKFETQETQSFDHASTSSIAAFPTFTINLNAISTISSLAILRPTESKKVNLLVVVMEVEGPESIRIKKGKDAGKEIGLLKLIVSDGDDEGSFCKITAWRETADDWGGVMPDPSLRRTSSDNEAINRGDVVYFENILANFTQPLPSSSAVGKRADPVLSFTASPHLQSRCTICYRTLPIIASDHRYRPDLRLAASDPGVKRVAKIASWFSNIAGIDAS